MNPVLDSVLSTADLPHAQAPSPAARLPWWRSALAQIALPMGASLLMVATVLAAAAWSLRMRTLQTEQQQVHALAQLAAEFTTRTLLNLDHLLESPAGTQAATPAPYLRDWWKVDAQGRVPERTSGAPPVLDTTLWQALQRLPGHTLLQALPASAGAPALLQVARGVQGPDGRFDGALVAVLHADHLGALWQQAQLGSLGALALYSTEGELLAHSQHTDPAANALRAPDTILQRIQQSRSGAFVDGSARARLYGYQVLDTPAAAVVVVSQPLEQVLAPWRQWVWISTALWILLALGAAVAGWQLHRHTHQRSQSMALAQRQALRLRQLSRRILDAQEAERSRVARELHDELGQSLTAIKINLQAQAQFKNADPARWQADNLSMVEDALQQVRRLSLGLRPSILDTLGLTPALQWMGRELSQRSHFAFALQQDPQWPALDDDTQTCLFRIAQEALTNIARHAHAQQVQITLRSHHEHLVMEIHDDGQGFDPAARRRAHHSMGLSSMAERAALVGGRLELASAPGQGCTISVRIPRPTAP